MEVVDSHLFTIDQAKFIRIKVEILESLIKRFFFFFTCFSNSILTEKQKPKWKHHIEVNYQLEKHNSKHIESNIPAVSRRATTKQFIKNMIKCPIEINFEKAKNIFEYFWDHENSNSFIIKSQNWIILWDGNKQIKIRIIKITKLSLSSYPLDISY